MQAIGTRPFRTGHCSYATRHVRVVRLHRLQPDLVDRVIDPDNSDLDKNWPLPGIRSRNGTTAAVAPEPRRTHVGANLADIARRLGKHGVFNGARERSNCVLHSASPLSSLFVER